MILSVTGLLFEIVGFAFLAFEVRRSFDFSRLRPMVYGFADLLKREHKKLGEDIFRPEVRGPTFEDDIFREVAKYYDLPMRISKARKQEIMHLGWLLLRDIIQGNDEWEKSIERSLVLAEGRLLSQRVVDWSNGVLFFFAGGLMQIVGLIQTSS